MEICKKADKQWSLCAFGEDVDLTSRVTWNVEPAARRFSENKGLEYSIKNNVLVPIILTPT